MPRAVNFASLLDHEGFTPERRDRCSTLLQEFYRKTRLRPKFEAAALPGSPAQIELQTGDTQWSVENADIPTFHISLPPKTLFIGGTWIETVPLSHLARICEIGSARLPGRWPDRFLRRLRNPTELLDTLNEIWWLDRFRDTNFLKMRHRMRLHEGSNEDVDWRFKDVESSIWLNVEVKRRRNDILRAIYPPEEVRALFGGMSVRGLFDKASDPFSQSSGDEINVVALTVYGGVTSDVKRALDDWFINDASRNVDAVAIWSAGSKPPHHEPWFIRSRKYADLLRHLLVPPATEDVSINSRFEYTMSLSEAIGNARLVK